MPTLPPRASIHGYTEVPLVTSGVGVPQVAPQSLERLNITRSVPPGSTSSHTATSRLLPALATTGKLVLVSPDPAGETVSVVKVRAPFVERAKLIPPVDVA